MENLILRRIAEIANVSIKFKNEKILTGTAWIDELPIDITCEDNHVRLNGVGAFSGDSAKLAKGDWRGKGKFRMLVPAVKQALQEFGFAAELYLTPISPVWERNYNLVLTQEGQWKIIF